MGKITLKFRAIIYTQFLKVGSSFNIEMLNSKTQEWFTFLDQIRLRENALTKQKVISDDIANENGDIRFLLDQMQQNSYPKTRIRIFDEAIQAEFRGKSVKIVAQNYDMRRTEKTAIFDFGENWILKEKDFSNFKETILVAAQHNIYKLYENIGQSEDKIQELSTNLTAAQTQVEGYKTEINDTRILLKEKSDLLTESEVNAKALADAKKSLEDSVAIGNVKSIEDQKKIDELVLKNTDLEEKVTFRINEYQKLVQEFADYRATKESDHPNKIAAKNVYTNFVRDVSSADEALQNTNYKLANISLDIKATVENNGNGVVLGLIDYDELKTIKGEGISSIKMDIERDTSIQELSFAVPDVTGMTFSKARSTLIDAGYRLEPIYQNPNAERLNGISVKQFPAAGTELQQGETVSVIFQ